MGDCVMPRQILLNLHKISDDFMIVNDVSQLRAVHIFPSNLPGRGCEVFVSNLPRDILMLQLHNFMASTGPIYEIRLLMDFSGFNRGLCYVKYFNKDSAKLASLLLTGCEISPGYHPIINMSYDNNTLMLAMIPEEVERKQVIQEIVSCVPKGLVSVTMLDEHKSEKNNTQRAILKYETHREALEARKKLWPGIELWDTFVSIDWAMLHNLKLACTLYFKNFPEHLTRVDLYNFLVPVLDIHTIIKLNVKDGAGYVVFSSDKYRKMAKEILEGRQIQGRQLDMSYKKYDEKWKSNRQADQLQLGQIPIDVRHAYFARKVDDLPTFYISPVHTKPGIYNEFQVIKSLIHNLLNKYFPCSFWTILEPIQNMVLTYRYVIKVILTINNMEYMFLMVQIGSDLATGAFYRHPFKA